MICGTTISDGNYTYKLIASVSYGITNLNIPRYTYSPLSGKYPIIETNSNLNYRTGSISAIMVGDDFDKINKVDRYTSTRKAKELCDFLNSDTEKIIQDNNGTFLCVRFTNVSMSYNGNYGNGIVTVNANWIEQSELDKIDGRL